MAETVDITQYGEDYTGVVPIYRPPPETTVRGRIFALHGLAGNWRTTWEQEVRAGRGVQTIFWPRDLLPRELPDCEISCVAWRSDLSKDSVVKIAHDLQQFIINTAPEKRAPIIFVVHSLGPFDTLFRFLWPVDSSPVSTSDGQLSLDTFTNKLEPLIGVIFLGAPHKFEQSQGHYRKFFTASKHHILDAWIQYISDNEGGQLLSNAIAQSPLKIIFVFEKPAQYHDHVPLFAPTEVSLESLADHEILMEVAKTHFDLARFTFDDNIFRRLCSGLKIMLDHWINLDQTLEMKVLYIGPPGPVTLLDYFRGPSRYLASLGRVDYKPILRQIDATELGSWVHLPANNTTCVDRAFVKVWQLYGAEHLLACKGFPGTVLQARSNFPTSRYILHSASCMKLNLRGGPIVHFNIFLPYLHWDTMTGAKAYTEWLKQRQLSGISYPHPLPALERLSGQFRTYHPRRSLDQYYYSRLEDTTERDNDQVISKQTINSRGGPKMIMVDQLWLGIWLSGSSETPSTIVTSFPDTGYARPSTINYDERARLDDECSKLDVRTRVLEAFKSRANTNERAPLGIPLSGVIVAEEVLTIALTSMLSSREDWSLDFLELFREAIGQATESHNKFFRVFTASMSNGTHRAFERSKMESFRLALRQEFQLSLEIADIIDELHMLKRLLQEQMDALRQGEEQMTHILQMGYDPQMCFNVAGTLESLPEKISALWRTLKNDYLAQITRMIEDAERAQTSILNLLDLQQKQDNIDEAHSSNQTALLTAKQTLSSQAQTDATNAQSQILFMFTFVTIVFLPLSFFTSYYGMNVQNPSGDQLLRQTSYVWKIMGGATFPIILLLLIGGVTWYVWSKNRAKKERIEELAELMKNGAMPSGLFKEDDPVYEEIKQRAESIREAEDAKNTQEEGVLRKRRPTETV